MSDETTPSPAVVQDVLAHLAFAATSVEDFWIEVGPERMPGRVGYPDSDEGNLPVWFDRNPAALPYGSSNGTPIRVSYEYEGEPYAWSSTVISQADATSIRVALPESIERQDRRASPRVRVLGETDLSLNIRDGKGSSTPVVLVDLSSGGLAFVDASGKVSSGDRLLARLTIGTNEADRIVLEAVAKRDGPNGQALIGCRYTSITSAARTRVSKRVYETLRTDR